MPDRKFPRLDEVFVTSACPINVGSAYSLKKETTGHHGARLRCVSEALRPEFQSLVDEFAEEIVNEVKGQLGETAPTERLRIDRIKRLLEKMMHSVEQAEGEDPTELDQGGPKPGTTGGR